MLRTADYCGEAAFIESADIAIQIQRLPRFSLQSR